MGKEAGPGERERERGGERGREWVELHTDTRAHALIHTQPHTQPHTGADQSVVVATRIEARWSLRFRFLIFLIGVI